MEPQWNLADCKRTPAASLSFSGFACVILSSVISAVILPTLLAAPQAEKIRIAGEEEEHLKLVFLTYLVATMGANLG